MPRIELTTMIRAPRERVFDLARSIDAHQHPTSGTGERAVAGVTRGLIGMGDEVTWEARHFGIRQRLTVRITVFDRPKYFQDIMTSGAFKRMVHDHEFADHRTGTLMRDRFEFQSPLGILGRLVDWLFLTLHAPLPDWAKSSIETFGGVRRMASLSWSCNSGSGELCSL